MTARTFLLRVIVLSLALGCMGQTAGTAYGEVLGYWRFETATALVGDPTYDWSWQDYSGNGHDAKSTDDCGGSAVVFGPTVPLTGQANVGSIRFPQWYPRADWAAVGDHDDFDFDATESFTVEAWMNLGTFSDTVDHQILLDGYSATNGWGFSYESDNDGVKFVLMEGGSVYLDAISDGALNDGEWHHVAGVREIDGSAESLSLYVDGMLQTSDTTTYGAIAKDLSNSNELWIGGADSLDCYGGYLDELRISQGLLQPSQFLNAPEPSTLVLLLSGLLSVLTVAWARRPRRV